MENNFLKISFKESFFKNIKDLYFIENKDILYYDNSHMNYIYTLKIRNIIYTFYGFFKDEYFNIVFNSYNTNLDVFIKNKLTLIVKLNWSLVKYNNNDFSIWIIENSEKNILKEKDCLILPIRNIMLENNLSIDDYLNITNYDKIKIKLKFTNTMDDNLLSNLNILNIFSNIFSFKNRII
jgi:hypothetical protein